MCSKDVNVTTTVLYDLGILEVTCEVICNTVPYPSVQAVHTDPIEDRYGQYIGAP